jgi:hypothetical protein
MVRTFLCGAGCSAASVMGVSGRHAHKRGHGGEQRRASQLPMYLLGRLLSLHYLAAVN